MTTWHVGPFAFQGVGVGASGVTGGGVVGAGGGRMDCDAGVVMAIGVWAGMPLGPNGISSSV